MQTANMTVLVLLGLLACAGAAPHYNHYHGAPPPFHDDFHLDRYFQDDIFDTRTFWDELRRELLSLDAVVKDFVERFPTSVSNEGVDGDVYRITIGLSGFDEKDIAVKAKPGLVMIQAVHKSGEGHQTSYVDMRTLPACVNETGSWSYEDNVLKIEFPLNEKVDTEILPTQPSIVTEQPSNPRREEMEPDNGDADQDADVGAERGDTDRDLLTNEVPRSSNHVEATTYAVDLKDEIEFVPVRQVK